MLLIVDGLVPIAAMMSDNLSLILFGLHCSKENKVAEEEDDDEEAQMKRTARNEGIYNTSFSEDDRNTQM